MASGSSTSFVTSISMGSDTSRFVGVGRTLFLGAAVGVEALGASGSPLVPAWGWASPLVQTYMWDKEYMSGLDYTWAVVQASLSCRPR